MSGAVKKLNCLLSADLKLEVKMTAYDDEGSYFPRGADPSQSLEGPICRS